MTDLNVNAIESEWLNECGYCDYGIGYSCTHPEKDYRPTMLALVREVDRLRGEAESAGSLRRLAADMLSRFTESGHPGEACLRAGWVRESTVTEWHQTYRAAS